jgi:hypothetical protein
MKMIACKECGNVLLEKHEDVDKHNVPIIWFRCRLGHWMSMTKKERKEMLKYNEIGADYE